MRQTSKTRATPTTVTSWAARYGQIILRDGIATIPWALYAYQGQLGLAAHEVWFIAAILAHKWDADLPYPRLRILAEQAGMSERQLQKVRASLAARGLVVVRPRYDATGRQDANAYDFSGLFARLEACLAAEPSPNNSIQAPEPAEPQEPVDPTDTSFVARFGRVLARAGIAAVPQALFTYQAQLGLTPQQVWFIGYILAHRWTGELPYPSLRRMVVRTGYSERQLHTIKNTLVTAGYLHLIPRQGVGGGQDTNAYDFSGLLAAIITLLQQTPPAAEPLYGRAPGRVNSTSEGRVNSPAAGPVNSTSAGRVNPTSVGRMNASSAARVNSASVGRVNSASAAGANSNAAGGELDFSRDGELDGRAEGELDFRRRRLRSKEPPQEEDSDSSVQQSARRDPPRYSPYIAGVILDFSRELGNATQGPANVTQALRLWMQSGYTENDFVAACQQAKRTLRQAQARGIANKMAYFFAVLRRDLGLGGEVADSA